MASLRRQASRASGRASCIRRCWRRKAAVPRSQNGAHADPRRGDTEARRRTLVLAVPAAAVLDSGLRKIAYVERASGEYVPAEPAHRAADFYPVLGGLKEGDRVAVRGNSCSIRVPIRGLPSLFYSTGRRSGAGHQHGAGYKQTPSPKPTGHEGHATPKPADPGPSHDRRADPLVPPEHLPRHHRRRRHRVRRLLRAGATRRSMRSRHRREAGHRLRRLAGPLPAGRGQPGSPIR